MFGFGRRRRLVVSIEVPGVVELGERLDDLSIEVVEQLGRLSRRVGVLEGGRFVRADLEFSTLTPDVEDVTT